MKKRFVLLSVLFFSMTILLFGCGQPDTLNQPASVSENLSAEKEPAPKDTPLSGPEETVSSNEENEAPAQTDATLSASQMKLYFVDGDTAEIVSEEIPGDRIEPQMIWEKLIEKGILTTDCKINSIFADPESGKIDLDANTAFGDRLRSMGTAGEMEILTCVTRSILETYGYQAIRITEDGHTLETGHSVLDDYLTLE